LGYKHGAASTPTGSFVARRQLCNNVRPVPLDDAAPPHHRSRLKCGHAARLVKAGTVMKTSLDHTKEAALQAALAGVQAAVPASLS
jgi:hypothetical protein